jgi:hypothetical protein
MMNDLHLVQHEAVVEPVTPSVDALRWLVAETDWLVSRLQNAATDLGQALDRVCEEDGASEEVIEAAEKAKRKVRDGISDIEIDLGLFALACSREESTSAPA